MLHYITLVRPQNFPDYVIHAYITELALNYVPDYGPLGGRRVAKKG